MNGKEIAAKLREALRAMNNSGAHWIQGSSAQFANNTPVKFCSIGAIRWAVCGDPYEETEEENFLTEALAEVIPEEYRSGSAPDTIVRWNDSEFRKWSEIEAAFEKAAKLAEARA